MTDSGRRDELARIIRETYDREIDGEGGEWLAIVDALAAAGWITPEDPPRVAIVEAIEHTFTIADGTTATTDEWPSDEWRAAFVANFAVRTVPRVPEGLTAEKLREVARAVELRGGDGAQRRRNFVLADEIAAWADVLGEG